MDDAQKAPAPSAETERAVEVAKGLSDEQRRAVETMAADGNDAFGYSASDIGSYGRTMQSLWEKGVCMGSNLYGGGMRYRLRPLGLAVARSLAGEG